MKIIAHRGLRSEQPENTVESISAALSLPHIHGVEFDVELARDKKGVVLHQETLVPSADKRGTELASRNFSTRDWVIEMDSTELVAMDAGSWMGADFRDARIPALKDVLALPWGDVVAYVELKDATYWGQRDPQRPKQVLRAVLSDLRSFAGRVNVISFNPDILTLIRDEMDAIPTTLALWTEWSKRITDALTEANRCGATAISLPDRVILDDPDWISEAHKSGLEVHAYPVSPARGEAEFLDWTAASQVGKWSRLKSLGVDAILTDFARESLRCLS
ncbi:MAG: glycerophosphodiester phosphodiesterase [Pseudomonadota bacterium]